MLALTGSTHWEIAEPKTEAGTTTSPVPSTLGIGGILEQMPPALFPTMPQGKLDSLVAEEPGGNPFIPPPKSPGSDPPYPIFLPTHVDHDGAVVSAASYRVSQLGGSLSEAEMRAVLKEAGWPDALISEALAVTWCESKWSPYASGDSGRSMGLFQVNLQTWFRYAGEDPERWADPVINARVALATYGYDLGRGYRPWTQWSCKP